MEYHYIMVQQQTTANSGLFVIPGLSFNVTESWCLTPPSSDLGDVVRELRVLRAVRGACARYRIDESGAARRNHWHLLPPVFHVLRHQGRNVRPTRGHVQEGELILDLCLF